MGGLIREAVPADAEAICQVHADSIRILNAPYYSPRQIEVWSGPKRPEHLVKGMTLGGEKMFVAVWDGRIVGWGAIGGDEIRAVYMSPDFTGRGLGSGLCRVLEGCAAAAGYPSVHLLSSRQAYPFYLKLGYRKIADATYRLNDDVFLEAVKMGKGLAEGPGIPFGAGSAA
jgi:putative acetyltransferase